MRKIIALSLVILILSTGVAHASDPGVKLVRGCANLLTGWVELPKNIYEVSVEHNIFSGLTVGLARGVGMMIVRTGAGLYEIVTFPFPIPEDYAPVILPEYVFN